MENGKVALVTGANGHVGSNLVGALVQRGYRVRASVRDSSDPGKTSMLPVGDIELASLDVRNEAQFEDAGAGVDILFHVAATYRHHTGGREADAEMIRDSMDGVAAAMRAAMKNRIRKVVLTSSVVTLPAVEPGGRLATEDDWRTDLAFPYYKAKTLAERSAWRLAEEYGVDLVAVLPGAIIGPGFRRSTPSIDLIHSIMLGGMKRGAPDTNVPLVDIRDVVTGHILAAEADRGGRFIICNDELPSMLEVTRIMHRIDPAVPAATRTIPDFALVLGPFLDWVNHKTLGTPRLLTGKFIASVKGKVWAMSNARAKKELGWRQEIPLEQSIRDTMTALSPLSQARTSVLPTPVRGG